MAMTMMAAARLLSVTKANTRGCMQTPVWRGTDIKGVSAGVMTKVFWLKRLTNPQVIRAYFSPNPSLALALSLAAKSCVHICSGIACER